MPAILERPIGAAPASEPTSREESLDIAAIRSLQSTGLASRNASKIVQSLTDEVGPRLAGSAGDKAARAWAIATLKDAGLENVHAEPVKVPHWERGEERASLVLPYARSLSVTALGGSSATPRDGIEGDIVEVESLDSLESMVKRDSHAVEGKIVFLNATMRSTKDGSGYDEVVGIRSRGAMQSAKHGAIAVVIRSVGTDHSRSPHTGHVRRSTPPIPSAALSTSDADFLHRVVLERGGARIKLTLTPQWLPESESANIMGEIRGREAPDEIVLLGAHIDSWDLGTGAIDDGAGCAIAIEAARLLTTLTIRPRRTVRVVLFAAEENALAGSLGYAARHRSEIDSHVVAIEADAGTDAAYGIEYLGATEETARFLKVADLLKPLGVHQLPDAAEGGTDLSTLRELGVPMLDIKQDMSTYFDFHHTANDTFDRINDAGLAQTASAYATVAFWTANMRGNFGRIPEDKRKND